MVVDKGKKAKVAENGGEENDHIDGDLVISIERLQEIQDEIEKVNEEASDKVLEVEQKYNEIRRPVYAKRNEIIKTIPDFWLTAFMSHPALGELLNEDDEKIFKNLISLEVEDSRDVKSGYSITFTFSPNPYFEDTKLVKTFSFSDDGTTSITGTKIRWKEGKDIVNGTALKKDGKRSFHDESFFTWFAETQNKNLPDGFNDEVAEIIKEDLWPNPLKYFNNEVDEDEDDDEVEEIEYEEEGSGDDDDDDDDGEDDDEDDEDQD